MVVVGVGLGGGGGCALAQERGVIRARGSIRAAAGVVQQREMPGVRTAERASLRRQCVATAHTRIRREDATTSRRN